jgi:hypothetical protein
VWGVWIDFGRICQVVFGILDIPCALPGRRIRVAPFALVKFLVCRVAHSRFGLALDIHVKLRCCIL